MLLKRRVILLYFASKCRAKHSSCTSIALSEMEKKMTVQLISNALIAKLEIKEKHYEIRDSALKGF